MILRDVIAALEAVPADLPVEFGFGRPGSYRGYYEQVAFEPVCNTTAGAMLAFAKGAIGQTFHGYKGGEYPCSERTECVIAHYGTTANALELSPALLRLLLQREVDHALWERER